MYSLSFSLPSTFKTWLSVNNNAESSNISNSFTDHHSFKPGPAIEGHLTRKKIQSKILQMSPFFCHFEFPFLEYTALNYTCKGIRKNNYILVYKRVNMFLNIGKV